jgi:hypothetical protein
MLLKLEPNFVHQEIVYSYPSVEASAARLDDLMMWRAAIHLRKTGNLGPLKTAMLIRVQREMNKAYEDGIDLRKNANYHNSEALWIREIFMATVCTFPSS